MLRVLLRRFCGDRYISMVANVLAQYEGVAAIEDVLWAMALPDERVTLELRALLWRRAETCGDGYVPEVAVAATRALAIFGDDAAVVEAVWRFGPDVIDDDLSWLLSGRPPMDDAILAPILEFLRSGAPEDRTRALAVIRMSRRHDLVFEAIQCAASAPVNSELRHQALLAAAGLVEKGTEIEVSQSILSEPGTSDRYIVADLLRRSATEKSRALLASFVMGFPFNHLHDWRLAGSLVDRSAQGVELARLLYQRKGGWPPFLATLFNDGVWERIVPVLNDESLLSAARDAAVTPGYDQLAAIDCVSEFDPEAAFEAALAGFGSDAEGREALPERLLLLDRERHVAFLLRQLSKERLGLVRWSICRALRWSEDPSIPQLVRDMTRDAAASVREAGYDCAGWRSDGLTDTELREAAFTERSRVVQTAVLDAIRRRKRFAEAQRLWLRLSESSGFESWLYAEALVTVGDSHVLQRYSDALYILPTIASDRPLRWMVAKWLEARAKENDKEAESEDFYRRRGEGR